MDPTVEVKHKEFFEKLAERWPTSVVRGDDTVENFVKNRLEIFLDHHDSGVPELDVVYCQFDRHNWNKEICLGVHVMFRILWPNDISHCILNTMVVFANADGGQLGSSVIRSNLLVETFHTTREYSKTLPILMLKSNDVYLCMVCHRPMANPGPGQKCEHCGQVQDA